MMNPMMFAMQAHNLEHKRIIVPKICEHCNLSMLYETLKCKVCGFCCHRRCAETVPETCATFYQKVATMVINMGLKAISPKQDQTAFINSVRRGDKKMVRYMIQRYNETNSEDINAQDRIGNTALHYMAMGESFEAEDMVEALKNPKLRTNISNNDGSTPLHYLCQHYPTPDCMQVGGMIIKRGGDVDHKNKNGETPLHKAMINTHVRFLLAEVLLLHGADVNNPSLSGETALHYAVRLNRSDLVQFLLANGATLEPGKSGETPRQVAENEHMKGIVSVFDRADEIKAFLKSINLEVYTKAVLEEEFARPGVFLRMDRFVLDKLHIWDPVHRTTMLQSLMRRSFKLGEKGEQIHKNLVMADPSESLMRNDRWIIQNDEIEFVKLLGSGGSGDVFRGLFLGQEVALKVMHKDAETNLKEFIREITIMSRVKSPYTISLFGAVLEPKTCTVMELAHNGSMYHVLQNVNVRFDWNLFFSFAIDSCEGMKFLHGLSPRLLHRDLKTLNLMVTDSWKVKVGDFGLSKWAKASNVSITGYQGTAAYMASEVIAETRYSTKSDVYSMGIIIWEILFRLMNGKYEEPFAEFELNPHQLIFRITMQQIRPTIPKNSPKELDELIRACWSVDIDKRPEFVDLLSALKLTREIYNENKAAWDSIISKLRLASGSSSTSSTSSVNLAS